MPNSKSWRFISVFSLKSFIVIALTCKSLIYFELIFVYDLRVQLHSFYVAIWLSQYQLSKDYSFPIECSWHSCQKSVNHNSIVLFLGFQLNFIDLYVYCSASIRLCQLLLFCSKFWNLCESSYYMYLELLSILLLVIFSLSHFYFPIILFCLLLC